MILSTDKIVTIGSILYETIVDEIKDKDPFKDRVTLKVGKLFDIDFGPYLDSTGIYQPDNNTLTMSFHKDNYREPLSSYPLLHPVRKSCFIHEFTHFVDCEVNQTYQFMNKPIDNSDIVYYNSQIEINAFISQAYYLHDNVEEFLTLFPVINFFPSLTINNKQKVIRKLYKLYDEKSSSFLY